VVSAWWLLLAFFAGGYAGILLMAMLVIARRSEPAGAALGLRHESMPARPGPDPAVDWVI
jgi:hypothetical protein